MKLSIEFDSIEYFNGLTDEELVNVDTTKYSSTALVSLLEVLYDRMRKVQHPGLLEEMKCEYDKLLKYLEMCAKFSKMSVEELENYKPDKLEKKICKRILKERKGIIKVSSDWKEEENV